MKVGDLVRSCSPNLFGLREQALAMVTKIRQTVDENGYVSKPNHYACDVVFLHAPHETVAVFESEIEKIEYAEVAE